MKNAYTPGMMAWLQTLLPSYRSTGSTARQSEGPSRNSTLMGHPRTPRPARDEGRFEKDWSGLPLRMSKPDRAVTQDKALAIGLLSAAGEGPEGPGAVSGGLRRYGRADPGGVSYGVYQFATNRGHPQAFLREEGRRWAPAFEGLRPGTAPFGEAWRRVAREEPEAFARAQLDYAKRTFFDVQRARLDPPFGAHVDRSQALRNVVLSTAVQNGPNTDLIDTVLGALRIRPGERGYNEAVIRGIYAERARRSPEERPRFDRELQAALRMLRSDTDRKSLEFAY